MIPFIVNNLTCYDPLLLAEPCVKGESIIKTDGKKITTRVTFNICGI